MLALPQDVMERVLRESLQRRFGVVVELGIELVSFEQSSEHVVAHLKKHTKEQSVPTEETVYVQYLVGTDGARSVVRKGLGLEFAGETRSKDCWIYGDVELTGLPEDVCRITPSACTPHSHAANRLGRCLETCRPRCECQSSAYKKRLAHGGYIHRILFRPPVKSVPNRWAVLAAGPDNENPDQIGSDHAVFEQYVREVTHRDDIKISRYHYLTAHRYAASATCTGTGLTRTVTSPNIRMCHTFGKGGRVFIAGDAAHTHPATGGQGLNSSVQDSVCVLS
jgi:2-polyprenyl-6-methoxyphenol hydroxylase-like FAD-dependent oxidoreductase